MSALSITINQSENPMSTENLTNLELLFFKAADQNPSIQPTMRANGMLFKLAKFKKAIYVSTLGKDYEDRIYLGKIQNGNFVIPREHLAAVKAVAETPAAHAILYGRMTGTCSICGRKLVDPVSVHNAIGPVCADKLGIMLEDPNALTKQDMLDLL